MFKAIHQESINHQRKLSIPDSGILGPGKKFLPAGVTNAESPSLLKYD
jgi:hypothetical protein